MSKVVSARVPDDLAEWLDEYAGERGVSRQALLETALAGFRDDCAAGVPEIRAMAARQAANAVATAEQGVGDCPGRGEGLGHVWQRGERGTACRFCRTPGRSERINGEAVGEPGFFERATAERVALFATLRQPQSVRGTTAAEKKG
jgi:predicted transcriptional regulator